MKFGQYLLDNKYPEWADQYLDYDALKKIIKSLEQVRNHIIRADLNIVFIQCTDCL
jgi:SPX domain protein involved in polyphosphate accumulation